MIIDNFLEEYVHGDKFIPAVDFLITEHHNLAPGLLKTAPESSVPGGWIRAYIDWEWLKRSVAYDESQVEEAVAAVRQAQLNLRLSTVKAVETLISNLDSPRNGVQAAKEILDRGGVPAHTTSDVITTVNINSDEMAEATKEVEEWEKKMLEGSGSDAKSQ